MDHEKRGYTSLPDYTASATHSPPAKAGGSLSLRDRMDNHKEALLKDVGEITHLLTIGWRGTEEHFYREIMVNLNKSIKVLNVNSGNTDTENNLKKHLNDKITKI